MPEGIAGAGNPDGPNDEITIGPLLPALPGPISRAVAVITNRIPREWPVRNGRRLTWRGWLLVAAAATVVTGSLKLTGVMWTSPRWVTGLGTGVTVTGPEQVAPGHGSPGAALTGWLTAQSSKNPATSCGYIAPTDPVPCSSLLSLKITESVKIGYVATDGTRALVGFTGKICSPDAPSSGTHVTLLCETNTDPAATFSAGKSYETLMARTVNQRPFSPYSLVECVNVGGKWYVDLWPMLSYWSERIWVAASPLVLR